MARPRIDIDINRIEELAGKGLSQAEICLVLGISEDTLIRRKQNSADFANAINRGRARAAEEVSNALYQKAIVEKDLGAIVWYEKTRRGLTDKVQQEHSGGLTIKVIYANPAADNTDTPKTT